MSTPLAIQLINEAYEKKSTFLDLGNCGLRKVPEEIVRLKNFLRHLNLGAVYYENETVLVKSANNLDRNSFSDDENAIRNLIDLYELASLSLEYTDIKDNAATYISQLYSLTSLSINRNNIGDKGAVLISQLSSLSFLDVSVNNIGDKGAEYISKMPSLASLNLTNNNIGDNGFKYIGRMASLASLAINNNNIGDNGFEYISHLPLLTSLSLNNMKIQDRVIEHIGRLSLLKKLDIDDNNIGSKGAGYISKLTSLTSLSIANNNIGEIGVGYISQMPSLTSLNLYKNNIKAIGAEYISQMLSLTSLNIVNNDIGSKGAEYISKLSSITSLNIAHNNIGDDGAEYISQMSSLTSLDLENNNISNRGIEFISHLPSLSYLSLAQNSISNDGAECTNKMSSLTQLNLKHNRISKFNPTSSNLLNMLNLENNFIEILSRDLINNVGLDIEIYNSPVPNGKILLYGNPIKQPPVEVINKGRDAMLEYWEGDLRPLNECKLIFVGDGSVGKTSLMKRLVSDKFVRGEATTHGINKIAWRGFENEQGDPIKVNLWDFGGQHIQHSLHQFFFTEGVVYVLVLNPRNDEKAGYWLDQVDKLGRNSQIIIVYNWKDERDKQADFLRNFRELRKTYKDLEDPIILSCETGEGMDKFKGTVKKAILANEGLKKEYPETWFNIKEKLETGIPIEKHYIEYPEYEKWCAEEHYNNPVRRRNLLRILDSVGSIVFFDEPVLDELQVLNPEWISTGAYSIITAEITRMKKGHLTWADLGAIFSTEKEIFSDKSIRIKYKAEQFRFILQLMLDYKLCQKNPLKDHEYLIPSAFGEKPEKDYNVDGGRHYRLRFRSPFEMLIIHRFIAKNIPHIISNDYWNSGMYFKHASSETYALVETNQYSQMIDCWIKGENIRGMWEVIRNDFREIFSMYYNFPVDEEVEYISGERSEFLNYNEMITALNNGVPIIPYDTKTGLKDIDVHFVLELFESPDQTYMGKGQIKVEVNPQININPVINSNNSTTETKKEQPAKTQYDTQAEDILIKKWQRKALTAFIISLITTTVLVVFWIKKWVLGAATWDQLEKNEAIKWIGIGLGFIWNGFIGKSVYDRYLDPSKAKALRENQRK